MIAYAAKEREIRICAVCGAKFSATGEGELCPVCILRGVPSGECLTAQAADSASGTGQSSAEIEHGSSTRRFEHYEVMLDKDGKPIELGRNRERRWPPVWLRSTSRNSFTGTSNRATSW
jgi:hypothetical protein